MVREICEKKLRIALKLIFDTYPRKISMEDIVDITEFVYDGTISYASAKIVFNELYRLD